jgi:hypothetical protein
MVSIRLLSLSLLLLTFNPRGVLAQTVPVPASPIPSSSTKTPLPPTPPNQTSPTQTQPTPSSPDVQPDEKTQETQEDKDPEQAETQSDTVVPKTEQNPFAKPDIDKLINQQFNEDMWRVMRGGLPCLETSANCLQQLQEKAIAQSPLLKEIDTRIGEASNKINEAKARNQKSIQLSVLTPALQYLLGPAPTPGARQSRGILDNLGGLFRGDTGIINALFNVIGIPFFQATTGGNADAQRNALAVSDIQVKIAELQRSRAQLADTIRDKVAIALVKFDEARTQYQTSQIVGMRSIEQFKIYELRYVRGNSDTESYLARQNQLDNQKAHVYESWAKMRRSLFEIKLLVLSVKEAEI